MGLSAFERSLKFDSLLTFSLRLLISSFLDFFFVGGLIDLLTSYLFVFCLCFQ